MYFQAGKYDSVKTNRLGFAKFLYDSAAEERQHAIMLLDYLDKRGDAPLPSLEVKINEGNEIVSWKIHYF